MKEENEPNMQEPNIYLYYNKDKCVMITSGMKWYKRLWYLLTNPFYYVFAGKWRL